MRGVHSAVDDIRRNVFTEVARLAYEGGDLSRVDLIPYRMIRGEVASTATMSFWSVPSSGSASAWLWA